MVEPGRSIVGRAGLTLYRVGSVKEIPGVRTYASVDGGMSDLLRPMLYGAVYEPLLANRADAEPTGTLRLVGKHCESGDVLVGEASLPPVTPGDLVCVPATGAYGVSMASNYNGVTRPAVLFVDRGRARLVTRRETYSDLVARDV
jgi:diaminopimelate decarboxylase